MNYNEIELVDHIFHSYDNQRFYGTVERSIGEFLAQVEVFPEIDYGLNEHDGKNR
jgi:hypothetical protein